MVDVTPESQVTLSNMMRDVLATYGEAQDLINIGAYVKGSNPKIDYAQSKIDDVNGFLKQRIDERAAFEEGVSRLNGIFADSAQTMDRAGAAEGGEAA